MLKYIFRFDAGAEHGLGHFSRSITIANNIFREKTDTQISILSETTAYMLAQKKRLPFNVLLQDQLNENVLLTYVKDIRPDVLFFDKLEELKEDTIRELGKYTSLILFHNYSRYATWAAAVIIPAAHVNKNNLPFLHLTHTGPAALYIGPSYVVINEKVLTLKPSFKLRDKVTSIAITTGGTDPKGVMLTLLNKIHFSEFPNISFRFLIGEDFLYKDKLSDFNNIPNVSFVQFGINAIIRSDIAIATFGVTTYELLYLGIPVISVAHASQNAEGSRYLSANYDCIADLGYIDQVEEEKLNNVINTLVNDIDIRRRYHEKGAGLIDGKGVERIKDIMLHIRSKS